VTSAYYHPDWKQPVAIVDANNKAKFFEYDQFGRLIYTKNNTRALTASAQYVQYEFTPLDGAMDFVVGTQLTWKECATGLTLPPGTTYDVYWGTDPNNLPLQIDNTPLQACNPTLLIVETTYYWKVVASDGPLVNNRAINKFTTVRLPVPQPECELCRSMDGQIYRFTWAFNPDPIIDIGPYTFIVYVTNLEGEPTGYNTEYHPCNDRVPHGPYCTELRFDNIADHRYWWVVAIARDGVSSSESLQKAIPPNP
jgi:hypothetical protein